MVHAPISYSDPTDAAHPGKYCADYTFYNGEHTLASGWWVVAGANESTARIDVSGDVNILLMDGAELTAAQGFHVTGTNRLTVWAQSGGRTRAGRLNVPSPENCSAGIGGNAGEAGGTVTVNGGVLEIAGGYKSAAIGGGQSGAGGMTTVNGGFVTATGGEWGTGLGGGMAVGSLDPSGNAGSITINGGEVTATGGDWCAGIGGAGAMNAEANNGSSGGTVVINGGIVTANGGSWSAGIGGGRYAGGVAVAIRGGTVTAVSGGGAHAIGEGNGWTGEAGSLAIDGMKVFASASASAPVAPAERESVCRGEWAKLTPCTEHDYDSQGVCTLCGSDAGPVPYLDPTDAASPGKVCEVYSAFTGQAGLTNGWYVARGAVPAAGRVEVAGDVHLILCDGAELTADAGICVAQGNSLTVWAQSDGDGMGALTAVGNTTFNAGIGGNENLSAGTLTINGGRVNASANQGAGIGGGGANTADATAGTGGTVTIRGGTVRVSSTFGSAIGGGSASAVRTNGGAGGTVAILGGTVTVSVESGYAQPVGHGYDTGSLDSGSLGIADGMRVVAGANEGAASDIPSSGRVDACRNNRWARLEPCPHGDASGVCPWCGLVEAWARGYVDWAGANGVAGAWNATDASGIHNVFRYVFDKPAGAFTNPPLIDIEIEGGNAVVITPPVSNTVGFAVSVVESSDVAGAAVTRRKPLDATGRTVFPMGSAASRFYRLSATEGDAEPDPGGVQLWENGPYWAECNVGASAPEECGYYFWWGDTVGYTRSGGTLGLFGLYTSVTWVSSTGEQMSSSPFSLSSCPTYGMDNSTLQSEGYIDATGNLTAAHDAATAHLGAPWRMPTDAEFAALTNNCIATWITTNGVSGRLVTGTGAYADRSIFLPAPGYGSDSTFGNPNSRGYYWSSTPDSDNSYKAWYLDFNSSLFQRDTYYGRQYGLSVRPVRDA
ncbi:MAG: hypothetical protein IJQ73_01135, partial [Kiritimatiellae bacterium]|nr:hypothetical protein [Kiritimatiellia bacterium]